MEADPTSMVGVIRTEVALKTVRLHARRADRAVAARDTAIREAHTEGASPSAIAEAVGLPSSTINDVITRQASLADRRAEGTP